MRILFACKRAPQGRDLSERPYGRYLHLPKALAALGHEVGLALLDPRDSGPVHLQLEGVRCVGRSVRRLGYLGTSRWVAEVAIEMKADWIVGASDAWVGCIAKSASRLARCQLALDAYDNFESYMPWNLPLHWLWRRALASADLVTAAGPQLAALLARHHGREVAVVPMAADPEFFARPRDECRRQLDLPLDVPIFGYFGGWTHSRGSFVLSEAFELARARLPNARLLLSGNPPRAATDRQGVIRLGYLPDHTMPIAINACDVSCVVSDTSAFGNFSYPAKLYEALACQIRVAATNTPPIAWIAQGQPAVLAAPRSASALADAMLEAFALRKICAAIIPTWAERARAYSMMLDGPSHKAAP